MWLTHEFDSFRELQKIITEERKKGEEKEIAVEKLEEQLENVTKKLNESKANEQKLQVQVNEAKRHMENEVAPQFNMEKLKRELQIMKEQHNHAVQQVSCITLNKFWNSNYFLNCRMFFKTCKM